MTFWKRLRTYLIGVGLGLIIVYVIFGDRELDAWTPEKRIMTAIDSSAVTISARAECQLKCLQLTDRKWVNIQQKADVDFSESNAQAKPCPVYHLKNEQNGEKYLLIWKVCESAEEVEFMAIQKEGKKCNC